MANESISIAEHENISDSFSVFILFVFSFIMFFLLLLLLAFVQLAIHVGRREGEMDVDERVCMPGNVWYISVLKSHKQYDIVTRYHSLSPLFGSIR